MLAPESCSGHRLDEVNVRVLCTLTAGIIRIAPHDNFTDLVQDTVSFIKVPTSLLTTLVREVEKASHALHD